MHSASPGCLHKPAVACPGRKLTKACSAHFVCLLGDSSTMIFGLRKISAAGQPAQRRESHDLAFGETDYRPADGVASAT
jgi:hypothetical protein